MAGETPDFGRGYEVLGKLGQGGFGAVFRARQIELDRPVAIKVIHHDTPVDVDRFLREGQAVSRLRHPSIVQIYAVDTLSTGQPFLVFEWVDGRELAKDLQEALLPGAKIVEVFRQLVEGLEHAHDQGVLHRDIKPQNVLLPHAGGLKIADFGLARFHESREKLTRSGTVMGTPTFMSPEQAQGLEVDHRSDLYSAGVLLYEMIAGKPPFSGEGPMDVLRSHIRDAPPRLADRTPGLNQLTYALLAKKPSDRPANARAVLAALDALDPAEVAGLRQQRVRTGRQPLSSKAVRTAAQTLATQAGVPAPAGKSLAAPIGAGVLLALAVTAGAWRALRPPPPPPAIVPLAISRAVPLPPSGLRLELGREVPAGTAATATAEGRTSTVKLEKPARVLSFEDLWPGTAYTIEVRDGPAVASTRVSMPSAYRAHYETKSTEDACQTVIHPRPGPGEKLLDVTVTPVDVDTGRTLPPVSLLAADRMLCTFDGLEPDHRYRLEMKPAASDRYMASEVIATKPGTAAATALDTLKRIESTGQVRPCPSPTDSEMRQVEQAVDARHVDLLVKILRRTPPLFAVNSPEFRFALSALARTFQAKTLPIFVEMMGLPEVQALPHNTRYELHKNLGWLQSKQAFDLLTGWPEYQPSDDPTMNLLTSGDPLWQLVKEADNLSWALELSDRPRAAPQFLSWASPASTSSQPTPFRRVAIAHAAVRLGDDRLLAAVAKLARDGAPDIRHHLIRCLVWGRGLRPLLESLGSKDPVVRALAVQGVGRLGTPADAPAVEPLLADPHDEVKAQAVYAAFMLTRGQARPMLIERLRASKPEATAAAWALGELGDATAADALIAALSLDTGGRAARALGQLRAAQAVEPLRALLRDAKRPTWELADAAWALGRLGDAGALPEIRALLARPDADRYLRLRASEAWIALSLATFKESSPPSDETADFGSMRRALADRGLAREFLVDPAFPLRTGLELAFGREYRIAAWAAWSLDRGSKWSPGIFGYKDVWRPFSRLGCLLFALPGAAPGELERGPGTARGEGELTLFCQVDAADTRPVGFATVRIGMEPGR